MTLHMHRQDYKQALQTLADDGAKLPHSQAQHLMARSSITLTADLNETGSNILAYNILATEIKQNAGSITVDHVTAPCKPAPKKAH
jgi:hypothetical protein